MAGANREPPLQGGVVDSHCHLFLMERDARAVAEEAAAVGVTTLVCAGIDPATSRDAVDIAGAVRGVVATAGMHPHTASEMDGQALAEIEALLGHPRVVAVGECGLDFFRMRSPREDQERAFALQLSLSRDAELPVVVHVRDAWPDALRLLAESSWERVVLHCFSGDAAIAVECVARGYFLSFAGNLTYPASGHLREAAATVPLDRILVETDSPFLAPQSLRGRDNSPANVVAVIEEVARVRGVEASEVSAATSANAGSAFPRLSLAP